MVKNLPNAMLRDIEMCKDFLPLSFLHKFHSQEGKLKKVSEKLWEHYAEAVGGDTELSEMLAAHILNRVTEAFESSQYADRVSASISFGKIIKFSKDELAIESASNKMLEVICGKYFGGKEQILKAMTDMMEDDLLEINKVEYV